MAIALHGHWHGHYGTAPCPVCQPEGRLEQNALTLSDGDDGRLLAHCKKSGCNFRDILAAAGMPSGGLTRVRPVGAASHDTERQAKMAKRTAQAMRLWNEAKPIAGTLAEVYLRARGITCPLPVTLRFHPECWHGPTAHRYPALVARIDGAEGYAVHRTYLHQNGGKVNVKPNKAMLGAARGGAVRLTDEPGSLVVAEGIETALSLASGLLRRPATIWAALSTSGMAGLCLPGMPGRITIATDGDPAGQQAGHSLAKRAHELGWKVSMLSAPEGRDWNDILNNGSST
jgi:hypothetical protein